MAAPVEFVEANVNGLSDAQKLDRDGCSNQTYTTRKKLRQYSRKVLMDGIMQTSRSYTKSKLSKGSAAYCNLN